MSKRYIVWMTALMMAVVSWGQTYRLTEKDQEALRVSAIDKVERFQSNCRYIADVSLTNSQKQSAIRTAMVDFMKSANIVVTSLSGVKQKPKLVKTYLNRLAYNLPDVYSYIDITFSDCHIASDFKKDPNLPNTYRGIVKVIQYFNAMTKEMQWKSDIVIREIEVIATATDIYKNNTTQKMWSVKLGNVEGKALQ